MSATEEAIGKAIEAVRGGMSKKRASTLFGVPRSTLRFRYVGSWLEWSDRNLLNDLL